MDITKTEVHTIYKERGSRHMVKPTLLKKLPKVMIMATMISCMVPSVVFASTIDGSIDVTYGQVSDSALKIAFENKTEVVLNLTGETVTFPASGLVDAAKKEDSTVTVKSDKGTYSLPLSALDFAAWAKELGATVGDLKVTVEISKLNSDEVKPVLDAIAAAGGTALSGAVEFNVTVEGKDGKKLAIDAFDDYVKRKLPLTAKPSKTATVALYHSDTKSLSFVPGSISDSVAEFWRPGNSVYTVVEFGKSFTDVTSHWAKADIELLANKLIVDGVSDDAFEANRSITRAEFAALAVRSLGLNPDASAAKFSDVNGNDWFAGAVGAAAKAGIVSGYDDGTFHPRTLLTREELATMIVRAFEFADGRFAIADSSIDQTLAKWTDGDKVSWGKREVALALLTGLMNGTTSSTLDSDKLATRAEAVTMLKRFLTEAEFID
ncbi:S-layer homology domain-containing protein [Paenibacillus flagellatus]|uniref:S-layer homology domain-containing protein n=1 Tax=Paenibacillus flagellatus TaxID=2211139 RepID=UPI001FE82353|nr:S-layer homology domain-containing protein [Paenibacillus flagellatus]